MLVPLVEALLCLPGMGDDGRRLPRLPLPDGHTEEGAMVIRPRRLNLRVPYAQRLDVSCAVRMLQPPFILKNGRDET